uniref:NADH dehydrogenase [ubiquinone] 1 beta subcomplex subunit 8, mitochondrial n=1 Tax=Aotus nancymaae TaxID=37293 RepID=A0A2K5DJA4_AOTNA
MNHKHQNQRWGTEGNHGPGSPVTPKGIVVARAGVLGVRWLQRASRNVVPLGARRASHLTKDMLPGTYPRTPEEQTAAAKKYMCVEDYEPYPDDGMGYGDYYPKLPDRSQQERDPWYDWDQPDLRLNWGETMHWDLEMYTSNRVDTSPTPVSRDDICRQLFGFVVFMMFMFWVGHNYPVYQPVPPVLLKDNP